MCTTVTTLLVENRSWMFGPLWAGRAQHTAEVGKLSYPAESLAR